MIQFILMLMCLGGWTTSSCAQNTQDWKELPGKHSIVYYTMGNEGFARDVSNKVELYYERIADDLGYARYSNFWTWENRVKISIYPNRDSYSKASTMPGWSESMADYVNRQIICYAGHEEFMDGLLPHEMTHLIFRDFVGFKGDVPLWLDEGIAQWEEPLKRERINVLSRHLLNKGMLLCLEDMMKLDIRKIRGDSPVQIRSIPDKNGGRKLLSFYRDDLARTYYTEAVSLVGFLIGRYGADSFVQFCRQLRDGKSLEDALRAAYSTHVKGTEDLENKWLKYVTGE